METKTDSLPTITIERTPTWAAFRFKEFWQYRELLYFLAWRDFKVRYKQTMIGMAWAILQPLLNMIVFSVFFGKLAKVPSEGLPYPIFAYCGLLPWQLFSFSLIETSNSVVNNKQLVGKIYFPRLIIPISTIFVGLIDFALAFSVLIVLMIYYGIAPTLNIIYLPVFLFLTVLAALGVGLWLSALNVKYRDVRYTLPFLTQFWLLATPIGYPSSLLPDKWHWVYGLNPMSGVVEGFRWAMIGQNTPPGAMFWVSTVVSIILLITSLYYFKRTEKKFADLI